jgi:hypothetical protein
MGVLKYNMVYNNIVYTPGRVAELHAQLLSQAESHNCILVPTIMAVCADTSAPVATGCLYVEYGDALAAYSQALSASMRILARTRYDASCDRGLAIARAWMVELRNKLQLQRVPGWIALAATLDRLVLIAVDLEVALVEAE